MPYLETAQQWLTQSHLLLQARPTTTRITTKYTIKSPTASKPRKAKLSTITPTTTTDAPTPVAAAPTAQEPIRATLTLKTYDPASGTTLKYQTTKAAEVSRLIQILGRLGRGMAGLPEVKEDVLMGNVEGGEASGVATPAGESAPVLPGIKGKVEGVGAGGAQGGKGGKKKKGKK